MGAPAAPQPPAPAPYGQPAQAVPAQGAYPHNPYAAQNPYATQPQMPVQQPYGVPAGAPMGAPMGAYPGQPGMPGMPTGAYGAPAPAPGFPGGPAPYPGMPGYPGTAPFGWRPPQPFRPLKGLAVALYALLGVSALGAVVTMVAFFMRASLLNDLIDDASSVSSGDADNADNFVVASTTLTGLVMAATAVVFVIWFYRARCNVDLFGPSKQRLARGWAIGGWFCPVVWFWFPKLIAHDVWKASDQHAPERGGKTPGRQATLWVWWVLLQLAMWAPWIGTFLYPNFDDIVVDDAPDLRTADYVSGSLRVLLVLASVAAVFVVRKITALQHEREATALAAAGLGMDPAAYMAAVAAGAAGAAVAGVATAGAAGAVGVATAGVPAPAAAPAAESVAAPAEAVAAPAAPVAAPAAAP
ncbi:DUF4328 domain-containing protein, partial [Yinghuangia seranimata]|uniref:DUF4328 domain-containing protein n=1 Tax=Yinghuangia seranimata TaxID=408067 RepID=UPI00248C6A24